MLVSTNPIEQEAPARTPGEELRRRKDRKGMLCPEGRRAGHPMPSLGRNLGFLLPHTCRWSSGVYATACLPDPEVVVSFMRDLELNLAVCIYNCKEMLQS